MTTLTNSSSTLDKWFHSDAQLHYLYPEAIQLLARRHWTPLRIAQMVVQFLTPTNDAKVLDIGSGVGKFCLAGAYYKPAASFFGVEQRKDLTDHAEFARAMLGLKNAYFINTNFMQLDFKQYDHFYFYNSFYENLVDTDKIDESISYSGELYNLYNRFLYKKLDEMRPGTRLATFHCLEDKIPPSYHLAETKLDCLLKFWVKI
jgi:SAM-dependent methyltransferase